MRDRAVEEERALGVAHAEADGGAAQETERAAHGPPPQRDGRVGPWMRLRANRETGTWLGGEIRVQVGEPERQVGRGEHQEVSRRQLDAAAQRVSHALCRCSHAHADLPRAQLLAQLDAHLHRRVGRAVLDQQHLGPGEVQQARDQAHRAFAQHRLLVVHRDHVRDAQSLGHPGDSTAAATSCGGRMLSRSASPSTVPLMRSRKWRSCKSSGSPP